MAEWGKRMCENVKRVHKRHSNLMYLIADSEEAIIS